MYIHKGQGSDVLEGRPMRRHDLDWLRVLAVLLLIPYR
jgi:hypothetical protein